MKHLAVLFCMLLLLGTGASSASAQGRPVPSPRPPEMNVQLRRAEAALRTGASVLEAKARVDFVLRAYPDDADARKLRTRVLLALDRPADALVDARRAAALRPRDGEAHLLVSEAARLSGDEALARSALDAAAERVMEDAGFHIRLSWNAALLGELEKAEAFARIAVALAPNEAAAYYQLARVFVLKDRREAARAILDRGLDRGVLDRSAIRADTLLGTIFNRP